MLSLLIAILLTFVFAYLAGHMARTRGRSVKAWLWLGALLGPFALPFLFLCPKSQWAARDPA
jgi:NO-binding membrane sensor protein with MHYT domain